MLLAIDTSTNYASLALADGSALLAEYNWRVGRHHGSQTLERARALLRDLDLTMSQLTGIAVATGPGSFNGLRVALATGKMLAFSLGIPLYGVPTLDVIAWGARLSPAPIWSLIDAGRGDVYAACYTGLPSDAAWAPQVIDAAHDPYFITTPDALASLVSGPVVVVGEWREAVQAALVDALGDRARFMGPLEPRRGAWLAALANQRAQRGAPDDPHTLEPLYLRRPNITSSARVAPAPAAASEGEEAARAL